MMFAQNKTLKEFIIKSTVDKYTYYIYWLIPTYYSQNRISNNNVEKRLNMNKTLDVTYLYKL